MNIMKPTIETKELLSALADGQLAGDDFSTALQACRDEASAQASLASWNTYHLIGEALRAPGVPVKAADLEFVSRLSQRLAHEPLLGAVTRTVDPEPVATVKGAIPAELVHHHGTASNDANFRWKLVAGFASLAAVSAIAWNALGLLTPRAAPQLAQLAETQQVVVASPQGPMVRDARLEELLAEHKQLGGATALHVPSGFLRNAIFDTSPNAGL